MNIKNLRQKVASGKVTAIGGGTEVWHGKPIPGGYVRVDITHIMAPDITLMVPLPAADQWKVKDVLGSNALWEEKCVRLNK